MRKLSESSMYAIDAVIEYDGKPIRDDKNMIKWVDESLGICKHITFCKKVKIYETFNDGAILSMELTPQMILKLADEIRQINSIEYDAVYDIDF